MLKSEHAGRYVVAREFGSHDPTMYSRLWAMWLFLVLSPVIGVEYDTFKDKNKLCYALWEDLS